MIRTGLAILLALAGANIAHAADAKQGLAIAQRWCASCHIVTPAQKSGTTDVPPFDDIAKRRTDAKELATFIAEPHPVMPPMALSRDNIADLVQYIRSLNPALDPTPQLDKDDKPEEPRRG